MPSSSPEGAELFVQEPMFPNLVTPTEKACFTFTVRSFVSLAHRYSLSPQSMAQPLALV
jgi:hypothetical protein